LKCPLYHHPMISATRVQGIIRRDNDMLALTS